MEILSSEINSNSISLVTDIPVTGLILTYGPRLKTKHSQSDLSSTSITITKEALGLVTLDNIFFKLEVLDAIEQKAAVGLYNINMINNIETKLYNANILKQELDNINYYDGVIQSLNNKLSFLEANDFFFNYITFLEKKLNGNNFIQNINRQKEPGTSN